MGMAASQARYLALVARKSNCEYEGQQINQARTALANQSANLFNQMLGLQVPVPPSTQDYTVTQYSFKDGENASTISNWEQLSKADPDYNYVVTHYYYTNQYTGSQKLLSDPQVQFPANVASPADVAAARAAVAEAEKILSDAAKEKTTAKKNYEEAISKLNDTKLKAATLSNHSTAIEGITGINYDDIADEFTVTDANGDTNYISYNSLGDAEKAAADDVINNLISIGALAGDYATNKNGLYFTNDGSTFAFQTDLAKLVTNIGDGKLNTYSDGKVEGYQDEITNLERNVNLTQEAYNKSVDAYNYAESAYNTASADYNDLVHPTYIGNCELTPLASLNEKDEAEILQIVTDLEAQGITSEITKCYNATEGYKGGIYSFKLNGNTYFTTYADLENSYASGTGINNIDDQIKMAYYNATYVSTKVEKTEKALLETDGTGRFTSIRFEDNSLTYTLTVETVTDNAAYEDAMNQYLYENAKYDKMVQDINARTSIIHQQDRQLELRLKQLDTEQNALATEIDAVKKVVDDNVEKSFKTFGG